METLHSVAVRLLDNGDNWKGEYVEAGWNGTEDGGKAMDALAIEKL